MNVRPLAAALAVLLCGAAQAEEPKYTPAYTACQEKSGGVDQSMLDCIKVEYQVQDKKLNDTYRQLMAALPATDRAAFKTSQRDWLKSRQSTCEFHFKVAGGTMANLITQSCYLDATAERVGRLSYWKTLKAD